MPLPGLVNCLSVLVHVVWAWNTKVHRFICGGREEGKGNWGDREGGRRRYIVGERGWRNRRGEREGAVRGRWREGRGRGKKEGGRELI